MSVEDITELGKKEVQEYIFAHTNDDENKILLKHKSVLGLLAVLVAQQITGRRKAETTKWYRFLAPYLGSSYVL